MINLLGDFAVYLHCDTRLFWALLGLPWGENRMSFSLPYLWSLWTSNAFILCICFAQTFYAVSPPQICCFWSSALPVPAGGCSAGCFQQEQLLLTLVLPYSAAFLAQPNGFQSWSRLGVGLGAECASRFQVELYQCLLDYFLSLSLFPLWFFDQEMEVKTRRLLFQTLSRTVHCITKVVRHLSDPSTSKTLRRPTGWLWLFVHPQAACRVWCLLLLGCTCPLSIDRLLKAAGTCSGVSLVVVAFGPDVSTSTVMGQKLGITDRFPSNWWAFEDLNAVM